MRRHFSLKTTACFMWIAAISNAWGAPQANWPESDHNILLMEREGKQRPSVACLNVSQAGNLKLFGKNWITTLRTPPLLDLVNVQQDLFRPLTENLFSIANGEGDTKTKNEAIFHAVEAFLPRLNQHLQPLGYSVSTVAYEASKAFNPKADPKDLKKTPDAFVQCPTFLIETPEEFQKRMSQSMAKLRQINPDLIFGQEVDLGRPPYNFPLNPELCGPYAYNAPQIVEGVSNACAVILFNAQRFSLDKEHENTAKAIQDIVQAIFDQPNDQKINVTPLLDKETGRNVYACNVHADYMRTNTPGKQYEVLAYLCENVPGLILAGDWNVQKKNRAYWNPLTQNRQIAAVMDTTPEDETKGGNPTWDGIFVSMTKPRVDGAVYHFLQSLKYKITELKTKALRTATDQQKLANPGLAEDQLKKEAEKVVYALYAGMLGEVLPPVSE